MPMTFTVATPGAVLPPARKPKARLAPLGKFRKDWTSPGVSEVVEAVTADGEWMFERSDDGTWEAGHLPTKTVVKSRLGSLSACRTYAGSGKAAADLKRIKAEAATKGEGNG